MDVQNYYDRDEYAKMTRQDIINTHIGLMIPFAEMDTFSNREKYLCAHGAWLCNMLENECDTLKLALADVVLEFALDEEKDVLYTHGNEALKLAFEALNIEEGESISSLCEMRLYKDEI